MGNIYVQPAVMNGLDGEKVLVVNILRAYLEMSH